MSKRWILFCAASFFLIQFVIFSYLVHKDLFTALDFTTTVKLQDNVTRRLDRIFSFFSDFGKFEVMTVCLFAIVLFKRKIWAGIWAISMYVGFHLIEIFGKYFVDHPPPMEFMLRTERIINFPQFHVRSEYSYPSGHSGRAIFLSIVILLLAWQTKRIPVWGKVGITVMLLGYNGVMLSSRVILGEHWLSDVIGGVLLGSAMGFAAGIWYFPKDKKSHEKGRKEVATRQLGE